MVARLVRDQEVVGSSPVASTKKYGIPKRVRRIFIFGNGSRKARIIVGSREEREKERFKISTKVVERRRPALQGQIPVASTKTSLS